jgi:hypothetical protein
MNTAKEWLKANGHIAEVTRGRISNENHKRLLAAVAEGVKFSDYPKGGTVVTSPTGESTYVKPEKPSETDGLAVLRPYRYPDEKNWHAVPKGETIYGISSFGMREVCRCGNSLVACYCDIPVIHSNVRVEVVPRR